jgi:endoglucanase
LAQYGPGEPRDFQPVREAPVLVVTSSILAVPVYRPKSVPVSDLLRRGAWKVSAAGDPRFRRGRRPARAGRWSKGWHWRYRPWGDPILEHLVYLDLGIPLRAGVRYAVNGPVGRRHLVFRGDRHPARAVKANQVGYPAESSRKFAYLGEWMGTLGPLRLGMDGKAFFLIDARSGRSRFAGTIAVAPDAWGGYHDAGDYDRHACHMAREHGQELYSLDFSPFREPGEYAVSVPGVGASFPFRIAPDAYSGVFRTVMRAIYHQRCGTALEKRHTRYAHGKCHRQPVIVSGLRWGDENQEGVFRELPKRTTGVVLPDAWGGYHDAGDYDRHACHMTVPYRLLELFEEFPAKFADRQFGIPESGNGVPDIVDEARWGMGVFMRMQDRRDGGVHGGIETFEHPNFGVAPDSAVERTIPLWAFAKDEATSLFFAAVTARACRVYRMLGATPP